MQLWVLCWNILIPFNETKYKVPFFSQPSISARKCKRFLSLNEIVPMYSTQLGWVRLLAVLFIVTEGTNFSKVSNCWTRELGPSQTEEMQESASNEHQAIGSSGRSLIAGKHLDSGGCFHYVVSGLSRDPEGPFRQCQPFSPRLKCR